MIERKAGFEETANVAAGLEADSEAASRISVVGFLLDEGDQQRCRANIRQLLADNADLKCIVGMNGYHGPILLDELRNADKLNQIRLVTFDEADATLDGIAEGQIYATIAQDPYMYGYEAVRILTELCRGSASELPIVGGGAINVRCEAIRQDNLADFRRKTDGKAGGKPLGDIVEGMSNNKMGCVLVDDLQLSIRPIHLAKQISSTGN